MKARSRLKPTWDWGIAGLTLIDFGEPYEKMEKFDVVIIGSGPGGGMAACTLAEIGLSVLILEKEKLPRFKPCGGGIPAIVTSLLDWDFSDVIESTPQSVRYIFNHRPDSECFQPYKIIMVNRSRFDFHLINRALQLGSGNVVLRDETTVTRVEEDPGRVVTTLVNGDSISSEFLIGADGAFGNTAEWLGLHLRFMVAAAIDLEVEVEPDILEREATRATFNLNCIQNGNGYGWIFPKDGYLTCGVGSWRGKPKLQRSLNTFMENSFPNNQIKTLRRVGYPIPLFCGTQRIATKRACLVGDAAGLVDPVMGEGIRFALSSGKLAAEAIVDLFGINVEDGKKSVGSGIGESGCELYQKRLDATIGRDLDALFRVITPLYLRAPDLFYRRFFKEGRNYFSLSHQVIARLGAG